MESKRVERVVVIAFAAVVVSFVSATWFSERQSAEIQRAALSIEGNAAPSIRHLATAAAELRHLQLLVHRALEQESGASAILEIDAKRARLEQQLAAYESLPVFPGEDASWRQAKSAVNRLDGDLFQIVEALDRGDHRSGPQLESRLESSSEALSLALSRDTDLNVAAAAALAEAIQTSRRHGIVWAVVLDCLGVLLAVAAAAWSLRVGRAYGRAIKANTEMAERRAEELDQFAGRMAHDVRTPLSVVGLSLRMIDRHGGEDPRFRRAVNRATAAFQQVQRMIEALFDFAHAGAHPDPAARASISGAADRVAVNVSTRAEEVGAKIVLDVRSRALVACSGGLIESAIGNLVNNALTYVEGRDKRVVTIATADQGPTVNVSVSDTGPGFPSGTDPGAIFEPHIRGKNARGRGLGLGLATVKKIVEAHGGRVGVSSSPDGCLFWFSLPILRSDSPAQAQLQQPTAVPS
jgi:signal transduction histidine kinase